MSDFFSKMVGALGGAASAAAGAFTKDPWMQVLSGGLSGLFGSFSQDTASKNYLNQQMTLLQNQQNFQREMFDKALQANKSSILDQYAQYAKLGINPLAINSSMSQANVSSPSAPSSPSAAYQSPTELAQIRLADSQAAKNYAEAHAIDPNESTSRTELNRSQIALNVAYTNTENGMRQVKIRDMENRCELTVEQKNLTKSQSNYYQELTRSLSQQIKESESRQGLLDEQVISERFNRQQTEIMNRSYIEHWSNVDKASLITANANAANVALGFARLEFEKKQWIESGKDLQDAQKRYWDEFTHNLKKDGKLKDCQVRYYEGTVEMLIKAHNSEFKYRILENEDGTKHLELDLQYLNEHGGLLLNRRYIEDMNSTVTGLLLPAQLNAKAAKDIAPYALGAKFVNSASAAGSSVVTPPSPPPMSNFWY